MFSLAACDKDFTDDIVRDNKPEIPVTFEGATTYGFNPYYTVPYNGGASEISFRITIPSNASLHIREVTKMTAGGTAINAGSLSDDQVPSYLDAPVAVNGTSVTITTSIAEFNSKVPGSAITGAPPSGSSFEERAFMFLLTMEDGSEIIPVQCRIRVTP